MCESLAKCNHQNSHLLSPTEVSGVSLGYIGSVRQMEFVVLFVTAAHQLLLSGNRVHEYKKVHINTNKTVIYFHQAPQQEDEACCKIEK